MPAARRKVGDVLQFDFQSDVYGGRYRLVENLGGGEWIAENLEPTEEEMNAILNDPSPYAGGGVYLTADGEALFPNTREETVLARIDQTGRRFKVRLVSRETYARYF